MQPMLVLVDEGGRGKGWQRMPCMEKKGFKEAWKKVFSKPKPNVMARVVVMFIGLICIALGISVSKLALMGTSPISSMPAVMTEISDSFGIPMTMGAWTFVFNLSYFVLEIALLRSRFKPIQLLQIPLFFVLSVSVDAWLALLGPLCPQGYPMQLAWLAASIVVLGFGIRVQLSSNLLMTPGDAAVQVIAYVSGQRFSKCKVIWDVSLMCAAALTSLVVLGGLYQVREGTIASAVFVGPMVRVWDRLLRPLAWLLPQTGQPFIAPLCPGEPCPSETEADVFEEIEHGVAEHVEREYVNS